MYEKESAERERINEKLLKLMEDRMPKKRKSKQSGDAAARWAGHHDKEDDGAE